MRYKGMYSPLFIQLKKVVEPFCFIHENFGEIPDNDFREKELENIANDLSVKEYCSKYQLDVTDFIILAKMSINYQFRRLQIAKNPNDEFSNELYDIINNHDLYVSREYIEEYRKEYKNHQETTELLMDTRAVQKNYLELLKKLQEKDTILATEMISKELSELGFNSKKDIKRLILQKR